MSDNTYISSIREIIDVAKDEFEMKVEIETKGNIPVKIADFPLEPTENYTWKWLKIENVVCVFIDMKSSTKICADSADEERASIYQYFTSTAVRILKDFGASYIDIKGDGAFGLFDSNRLFSAIASAVTFKTFCHHELSDAGPGGDQITCHIGIHMADVLVKRIGMRRYKAEENTSQNEVWAGNPVNMAAKLASIGNHNDLLLSKDVYKSVKKTESDEILKSCGCGKDGKKIDLWELVSVQDKMSDYGFTFNEARRLNSSGWCSNCGASFCDAICNLDQE